MNLKPLVSTSRQAITHVRYGQSPRASTYFHHIMLKDRTAWALGVLVGIFSGVLSEEFMFHSVGFWVESRGLEFSSPPLLHEAGCTFYNLH